MVQTKMLRIHASQNELENKYKVTYCVSYEIYVLKDSSLAQNDIFITI